MLFTIMRHGLVVDDASVQLGGLLDETGDWVMPQCRHRHGLSIDLVNVYDPVFSRMLYEWLQRSKALTTYNPGGRVLQRFRIWRHGAYGDWYERWHLEWER